MYNENSIYWTNTALPLSLNYISEGSVSHINGVRPSFLEYTAVSRFVTFLRMLHTW